MEIYPSPESFATAKLDEVADHIKCLGLQNSRAKRFIALAKGWIQDPPTCGHRHRILHYPNPGNGQEVKNSELLDDSDNRTGAWEIAHLPGVGAYALDSWRIFCRDRLRGLAKGWNGEGSAPTFEPEWKRVVPKDKELRAFIRWLWLREGIIFDIYTGKTKKASQQEISLESTGGVWEIADEGLDDS
jgi:methyl-CpG-binding domain protein 4